MKSSQLTSTSLIAGDFDFNFLKLKLRHLTLAICDPPSRGSLSEDDRPMLRGRGRCRAFSWSPLTMRAPIVF